VGADSIERLPPICRFAALFLLHSLANQISLFQALSNLSPRKQSPLSPHYSSFPPPLPSNFKSASFKQSPISLLLSSLNSAPLEEEPPESRVVVGGSEALLVWLECSTRMPTFINFPFYQLFSHFQANISQGSFDLQPNLII